MLAAVAVCNCVAAFADEGSLISFFSSMTDFAFALGAGGAFILQAGAGEVESRALASGLNLLAAIIELFVIGANLGASLLGAVADGCL